MKTTLTILAAILMPGGLIILSIGLGTVLFARYRARGKFTAQTQPAVA